jgi:hypothetical protein
VNMYDDKSPNEEDRDGVILVGMALLAFLIVCFFGAVAFILRYFGVI